MTKISLHQIYISLRWRILKKYRQLFVPIIKRRIGPATTIVCNNCFCSRISQDCGYRYNSPTAGLYINYPDYIWFLKNLKDVKGAPLAFRCPTVDKSMGGGNIIGFLSLNGKEIEIHFLHYHSEEEAREKWQRRAERINLDDIIVIGTEQGGCTREDIVEFCQLPYKRKLFVCKSRYTDIEMPGASCLYYAKALGSKCFTDLYDMAHICYRRLCRI